MNGINWFDIIIIAFSVLLGLKGIINGLVRELCGLCGIVGGVLIASRFAKNATEFIEKFYKIDNESLALFAGFILVLVIVWVFFIAVGNILAKLLSLSGLGFLDRFGGFFFGAAKIFFIFAILITAISNISFLNNNLKPYTLNSKLYPFLLESGDFIMKSQAVELGSQKLKKELEKIDVNKSKTNDL